MKKKISEMSKEELWQLFPIFLTGHQVCWKEWYLEEEGLLKKAIPEIQRISHVGSTAVPDIWAKNIVDILVEIPAESSLPDCQDAIEKCGYTCMSRENDRISFNKGYTEEGFARRVFHLHLRHCGDNAELYFRDYLLEHPDTAKEYEALKLRLWKQYEHNRNGYTNAKTEFIQKYTAQAKTLYQNRY